MKIEIFVKIFNRSFIDPQTKIKKVLELDVNPKSKIASVRYNTHYSKCVGCILDYLNNEVNQGNGLWAIVKIDGKEINMNNKYKFKSFLKRLRKFLKNTYGDLYAPFIEV